MGNRIDTRIILGTLRYKSAPETTLGIQIPLVQTVKENVEFDRSIDVNLAQVFDDERQRSSIFRPVCKFSILFKNSYTGTTNYVPFENNLLYVNEVENSKLQCEKGAQNVSWGGFPQYSEFDFIRNDYNVVGYTQPPNNHITFESKSASTYNWLHYLSYPVKNNYVKPMRYTNQITGNVVNWKSGDGIPFNITNMTESGNKIVSFKCPVKHGLSVGEYVRLSLDYNGNHYFEVYSLGDGTSGTEEYVFNIFNYGFLNNVFSDNKIGTFKRVLNIDNPSDSTSEYYVKQLKILTNPDDSILVKSGFEQNIFGKNVKYESVGLTPNSMSRVSLKEGSQSYSLSFNVDFDISAIRDNHKRPITELYYNVIWRGYFGWTFGVVNSGLQQGFEFNLPLITDSFNNVTPDTWWSNNNSDSKVNTTLSSYVKGGIKFTYVNNFVKNDIIDGDYSEWNSYEQKERSISTLYHKIKFSTLSFDIRSEDAKKIVPDNILGYYYQPNYKLTIREYSDYIETGEANKNMDIPDYSHFSTIENAFIWRDIYTYGYKDPGGIGVDYPFLNGKHYPYASYVFRIIPEGTNFSGNAIINEPTIDNCE